RRPSPPRPRHRAAMVVRLSHRRRRLSDALSSRMTMNSCARCHRLHPSPFTLMRLAMLAFLISLIAGNAWACPGCQDALFNPAQAEQAVRTARGFAWSIYTLLAVPMLLVGGITALVVRASRRARR